MIDAILHAVLENRDFIIALEIWIIEYLNNSCYKAVYKSKMSDRQCCKHSEQGASSEL